MADPPIKKRRGVLARLLIVAAFAFLGLVVCVVAGLLLSEGWGKAAWSEHKALWEARGESLDWRSSIPAEIPDLQNFIAHPVFEEVPALEQALDLSPLAGRRGRWTGLDWRAAQTIQLADLFSGADGPLSEAEALSALEAFLKEADREARIAQLAEAARRPACRLALDYENGGIFEAHTSKVIPVCRQASLWLSLRGLKALREETPNAAWIDWETIAHLSAHVDAGPGIIHGLVSLLCSQASMQILWEGLRSQQWSDFQLERFEELLEARDYQASLLRHFREERAGFQYVLEECLIGRGQVPSALQASGSELIGIRNMPKGWLYRNLVSYSELLLRFLLAPEGTPVDRIDYAKLAEFETAIAQRRLLFRTLPHPHHIFVVLSMPMLEGSVGVMLRAQADNDMARIAVANERLRIRSGRYAAQLSQISLTPMPIDPISGEDYHYQIKEDGTPLLYGVGANQTNEGGRPARDWRDGDWVWQYTYPDFDPTEWAGE